MKFFVISVLAGFLPFIAANWFTSDKNEQVKVKQSADFSKGWTDIKEPTVDENVRQWGDNFGRFVQNNFPTYDSFREWAYTKGEVGRVYINMIPDSESFARWTNRRMEETGASSVAQWASQKVQDTKDWYNEYKNWASQKANETADYTKQKVGEATDYTKRKASEASEWTKDSAKGTAQSISDMFPDYDSVKSWAKEKGEQGKRLLERFPDYQSFSEWIKSGLYKTEEAFKDMFSSQDSSSSNDYDYESFKKWAESKGDEGKSILQQIPDLDSFTKWTQENYQKGKESVKSMIPESLKHPGKSLKETVQGSIESASLMFSRFSTPMDIRELSNVIQVQVDVPGVLREHMNVEVKENVLYIESYRAAPELTQMDEGPGTYHYHERYEGKSVRTFPLPVYADERNVKASLEDGVLTVTIPKIHSRTPGGSKKISISK